MRKTLRYGIMGAGNIARQFADGVRDAHRSTITATASRSLEKAKAFNAGTPYGDYAALLDDPQVDAVYVALPNSMHHEWTLRCLAAGKHVLCEKPMASDEAQTREMFDAAQRAGLLLMEAFMYRCHPQTHAVLEQVRSGAIGKLKLIRTAFCYSTGKPQGNIRFDAALAGGALMDIGCYCISMARLLAGCEPTAMHAVGRLGASGIDEYATGVLDFPGDVIAEFCCGMTVQTNNTAIICGDEGYLEIPWPWKPQAERAVFIRDGQVPPRQDSGKQSRQPRQEFVVNAGRPLYAVEADDFAQSVLDGKPLTVSKQDTLGNMHVLDELRRQVGVKF
ncbi:MAG: Gfo/Idh/MocA family oxidoreductase [Phycisphaeraceae bacterium]|nr:Gfo/Idh/MocA family oxidoreductase [Phycisphaeraceae bacterium]